MGYMHKYLDVDLTSRKIHEKKLDLELAEKFIGGKGLGAKILYDELKAGVDPLSPENIILFMTGPLTGTSVVTSGRWCIVTKSPHTGIFLDSQIGGNFGHRLKKAGYDFILVRGKAANLCYLLVTSEGSTIISAKEVWGRGTFATEEILQGKHPKSEVASIGIAGEKLVTYANVMTGRSHMAGRGGSGAVMGSKNLKAVVVSGNEKIDAVHDNFRELTRTFRTKVQNDDGVKNRNRIGTMMWVNMSNQGGFLPTKNYQSGVFEEADSISGETMLENYTYANRACYGCLIACGKANKFDTGKYAGLDVDGPEYETTALLGSNCGINDLAAVAKASEMCDDLGIDTITAGATISFAMECVEKGYLQQSDVDNLTFGNDDAVLEMVKLISHREKIGDLFAQGSKAAAVKIGHDSMDFAIQVKGNELAGVEPRGSWGMALAYSTSDRGACHQRTWTPSAELRGDLPRFSFEGVAKFVKESQDERAACFSLVVCDFLPFSVPEMVELLNSATGFSYTPESYLTVGERIWNLTRMFNVREGITADDDILPKRFYTEKMPEGDAKGLVVDKDQFEKAKLEYYSLREWSNEGIPTEAKLRKLGL
ncbi:MAG: aldehyde ferredoxin oxidoreductase family protein [Candidatus Heimdallarchaeota archaeon]|nr:aldehyde ferredoxin oxidoreductase family protein [Candidatus Heimdallarchaeota archaeon]MCG3256035.1 aldehyde ferredoxin oxidoreductase family protein [Candidatus Heimdallarchaeota archaeon]MCK4611105.1 aldehyde ferredoxin oxidoreductase family protein [Candidatus Heimdallarchaeota archaeon]